MSRTVVTLVHGDCLDVLRDLPAESVDSIVTDPPYGLGFMGKAWDDLPPGEEWAKLCLAVLKPGGHLLAFGGTRTSHRLACAIEDAGFEIRDSIAWLYGSGFPKSLDVSKAIDKAAGAEREVVGRKTDPRYEHAFNGTASSPMGNVDPRRARTDHGDVTAPATPDAERWQGWGTALKPAHEPIVVARKPLAGTVAANVLTHGTGALNVDGCRVGMSEADRAKINNMGGFGAAGWDATGRRTSLNASADGSLATSQGAHAHAAGRWPANVVLDESQAAALDQQGGNRPGMPVAPARKGDSPKGYGMGVMPDPGSQGYGDSGGASRFFYVAKAPKKERPVVEHEETGAKIAHPTVKPLALMRWLVRLVTPPGGVVLEPFAGSGATVEAAMLEGFDIIAIEREADYLPLIRERYLRTIEKLEPQS